MDIRLEFLVEFMKSPSPILLFGGIHEGVSEVAAEGLRYIFDNGIKDSDEVVDIICNDYMEHYEHRQLEGLCFTVLGARYEGKDVFSGMRIIDKCNFYKDGTVLYKKDDNPKKGLISVDDYVKRKINESK